jgi:putative CRISPR-associated protein (TIGR02619 family)
MKEKSQRTIGPPFVVHIVTVGVSTLQNARRELGREPSEEDLLSLVQKDPRKASAELNTLLPIIEEKSVDQHRVYLLHSDTAEGRFCASVLKQFLSGLGLRLHVESVEIKDLGNSETFTKGLANLLEQVVRLIRNHYAEGDRVFIHASGGFKPETAMAILAANLPGSGAPVFYVHESFRKVIRLPALPIWPRRRERFIRFMEHMCRVREVPSPQLERMFMKETVEEAKRLGWVEQDGDRIRLTPMGLLLWERFEKLRLYGRRSLSD